MTDVFAEIVLPVFQNVIDLHTRLASGEPRSLVEVKRMTSGWVEEGRRRALGSSELKRSYDLAMFGLVAWIDEILTESEWGRDVGSPEEILEWDLFASRDRASLFYDHAEAADQQGDADALEVYLLAVTQGFRGELVYDDAKLHNWVHRVYGRVSEAGSLPAHPFARESAATAHFRAQRGPSLLLMVSVLVSITAIVTLAAYLLGVHLAYDARARGPAGDSAGHPPAATRTVRIETG